MDWLTILLRIIHIFSGVFWAGTTFFFVAFLSPSVNATAPEGSKVMGYLIQRTRYVNVITLAAVLNPISGLWMYWNEFHFNAFTSSYGWGLSLGGLAGLIAAGVGLLVTRPAAVKMGELGKKIQAAGGPPTPDQMKQLQLLGGKLASGARLTAILLTLALLGMSTARYL